MGDPPDLDVTPKTGAPHGAAIFLCLAEIALVISVAFLSLSVASCVRSFLTYQKFRDPSAVVKLASIFKLYLGQHPAVVQDLSLFSNFIGGLFNEWENVPSREALCVSPIELKTTATTVLQVGHTIFFCP